MNSTEALREFAEKVMREYGRWWGIEAKDTDKFISDLTALISEHYVAKEEVDKMVSERNNTNYDMKPIEVTMDYAIKKLKKLIRVQRTCPQGHGKMKRTSFGPYWCLNCQKYYE